MQNRELSRQIQRLSDLFKKARTYSSDLELQAHWARYLCVLSAGLLENAVPELYSAFAAKKASPAIARYVSRSLDRVRTPKSGRFIEIAGQFNEAWQIELDAFLDQHGRREAIDAIVNNRHLIAHGGQSNITLVALEDYYKKTLTILDFIEGQCGA
jgi:hypothetical protein